ncbi:MAG: MarR family transcriptional regulator [Sphingomonas sp.]
MTSNNLSDEDYEALADFRHALRQFQAFSESHAAKFGLTVQQHQALLAIRGAPAAGVSIGYIADRMMVKPHSASGLITRLEALDLIERRASLDDGRQTIIHLTAKSHELLSALSSTHREEIVRLRPLLIGLLKRFP